MTIKIIIIICLIQYPVKFSTPVFESKIYRKLNIMNEHLLPWTIKKRDLRFFDHVSCTILLEKYKNFHRKVDQWLVFAVIRQKISSFPLILPTKSWTKHWEKVTCFRCNATYKISSLRSAIVYEDFIFTHEYAFAERCCFLTYSFEVQKRRYFCETELYEN